MPETMEQKMSFKLDGARPAMACIKYRTMMGVISLLESTLLSAEFESNEERDMAEWILAECKQAFADAKEHPESQTPVRWHPYPTERPGDYFEFSKLLLVTCVHRKTGHAVVWTRWSTVGGGFNEEDDVQVVAWAEMPAPYVPDPEDTHPDAEIARKYVERDPETLRQLGLFD